MKIAALALMLFASIGHAQDAKYLTQGKDFANSIAPTSAGQIVNPQGVNANAWSGTSIGSSPPKDLGAFSAPNTSSSAMDQAKSLGLMGLGNSAMDRCANYTPSGDPVKDQECAAVNFMSQRCLQPAGTQTQIVNANGGMQTNPAACEGSYGQGANKFDFFNQVKSSDTIFNLSNTATKDAGKTTGQVCTETEEITKPAESARNTCVKSTSTGQETCSQILRASCSRPGGYDGCDQGGIIPGSWAGDMATSFTADGNGDYSLRFGTFADNYWGGWGATYDRTLNFQIKDPALISKFILTRASFDDWLMVQVNGSTIYVGPYGGDRLIAKEECFTFGEGDFCYTVVQYCSTCTNGPELSTNWNIGLNIDIKPYLRHGGNTIFMRTIVAGAGEGAIEMKTRQYCPAVCSSYWEDRCTSQENRAGRSLGTP
jgi:hypothetical protein